MEVYDATDITKETFEAMFKTLPLEVTFIDEPVLTSQNIYT